MNITLTAQELIELLRNPSEAIKALNKLQGKQVMTKEIDEAMNNSSKFPMKIDRSITDRTDEY